MSPRNKPTPMNGWSYASWALSWLIMGGMLVALIWNFGGK